VNSELTVKRDDLRRRVDRDRAKLHRAVQNLRTVMQERMDFGQQIAHRPYQWIAGGFLVGFLLGLRAKTTR